jgi:hypothetical protein
VHRVPCPACQGGELTPGRQINPRAEQKPTEAGQKMKSTVDLGCSAFAKATTRQVGATRKKDGGFKRNEEF